MAALTRPDLYIAGRKMQTAKTDPMPALAGLNITWGTDTRFDFDPPATCSGQLLVTGAIPSYLDVGAPVGVVDPLTARTLFAGTLEPLTARNDASIHGARRISWTAASPRAELEKHRVLDIDWPHDEPQDARRWKLAAAMPRGWDFGGTAGWTWINQGRQLYQSVPWMDLAARYARSYRQRLNDTSYYVPGAGLKKRLTITDERPPKQNPPYVNPGPAGVWQPLTEYAGFAVLPPSVVGRDVEWEKTPDDVITDIQVTTTGGAFPQSDESAEFEYWMSVYVNNSALQDAYGYRQLRVETALSSKVPASTAEAIRLISNFWLNTATDWRPTVLPLPDSRLIAKEPLLNLLAVDTRHRAGVRVSGIPGGIDEIRAPVLAGSTTWTGHKWDTTLTLGMKL